MIQIKLWYFIPVLGVICSGMFVYYFYQSNINEQKFLSGELFNEQLGRTPQQTECMEWGNGWSKFQNGTEGCSYDSHIVKPIGYSVKYCSDGYGGRYLCSSGATGCIAGYKLIQDHYGDFMCVEQKYYDSAKCEKYWNVEWLRGNSGYGCSKLSDDEIQRLQHDELLNELQNLKKELRINNGSES